jgi:hypothetical protein
MIGIFQNAVISWILPSKFLSSIQRKIFLACWRICHLSEKTNKHLHFFSQDKTRLHHIKWLLLSLIVFKNASLLESQGLQLKLVSSLNPCLGNTAGHLPNLCYSSSVLFPWPHKGQPSFAPIAPTLSTDSPRHNQFLSSHKCPGHKSTSQEKVTTNLHNRTDKHTYKQQCSNTEVALSILALRVPLCFITSVYRLKRIVITHTHDAMHI